MPFLEPLSHTVLYRSAEFDQKPCSQKLELGTGWSWYIILAISREDVMSWKNRSSCRLAELVFLNNQLDIFSQPVQG